MSERICLVEDDPTIREFVGKKLESVGYSVDAFDAADDLLGRAPSSLTWDLFIVDIMLRGNSSGLDLCRAVRQSSPTLPVLVLSALSEPSDRIEGLKVGADDYLTKPFEMEELLLRVSGMLKRRSWYGRLPADKDEYSWDDRAINFLKLEGRNGDSTFPLTQKEVMLMKLLIEREGQVVSRDEILDRVWGYDVYPSSRTVDNFILRLRRVFEAVPGKPRYMHSVRGMGYKFTSKAE